MPSVIVSLTNKNNSQQFTTPTTTGGRVHSQSQYAPKLSENHKLAPGKSSHISLM